MATSYGNRVSEGNCANAVFFIDRREQSVQRKVRWIYMGGADGQRSASCTLRDSGVRKWTRVVDFVAALRR